MVLTSVTGSPVVFGFAPLYSVALVSVLQELLCGICVRTVDKPDQNIKTCKTITTMTTKENIRESAKETKINSTVNNIELLNDDQVLLKSQISLKLSHFII